MRSVRRAPLLSLTIATTLALGVGASAATFSLVDRLLLRNPAVVTHPAQLRRLYLRSNWSVGGVTVIRPAFFYPSFRALSSALESRAQLAAYTAPDSVLLRQGDEIHAVRASYVSANFLPLLGARAARGRAFSDAEDRMGNGALVTVISDALWRARFGADPSVLGRTIDLAHQSYTVIGIAPANFTGVDLDATEAWLPLATFVAPMLGEKHWWQSWRRSPQVRIIGRVANGTMDGWLSSVATAALRAGERDNVDRGADTTATVLVGPILESLGPSIDPVTEVAISKRLIGVVVVVLVIACANVATLLLIRAMRRRRDIATRLALGISRARLVRQFVLESLIISFVAGVVATVVGWWGGELLRRLVMPETHWGVDARDARVVVFSAIAAIVAGLGAGILPALQSSRPDLTAALGSSAREGAFQRSRLRTTLIAAQIALSVLLLVGAGLFARSLYKVRAIDLGYDAEHLVYATVSFLDSTGRYVDDFSATHRTELAAGLGDAAAQLARVPGVEGTALASSAPLRGYAMMRLFLDGTPVPRLGNRDPAVLGVSPEFFATTGVRILRGRALTAEDRVGAPRAVVVNETAARFYWPGKNPLGQCLVFNRLTDPCYTVVGIAKNSHLSKVIEDPTVELYTPLVQGPLANATVLVVRTAPGNAERAAARTWRVLRHIFPTAEVPTVVPLATALAPQFRPWRVGSQLFGVLGALAMIVSAIGIYSAMAYSVAQRTHDIGVRMALGAEGRHITALVIGDSLPAVVLGLGAGIALSLAMGRLVSSLLYGILPNDLAVLAAVTTLLLLTAVVASIVPARRARVVDPAVALRAE
ncbi:MAG: ADOP family duplicated permease [Gemmatimonadota bacterium]|nr:ADOP family duplicated permease [Gemmatimonadota bacterium]